MKLPIQSSPGDQGSFLQLDPDRETIALLGPNDEILGLVTWATMNQFIRKTGTSGFDATRRNYPRASLALKVRYKTPDGKQLASVSRDIGGGGLFIETATPLSSETDLDLEVMMPDPPYETISAKGRIVWTRPYSERSVFLPGMGLQFTEITDEARRKILDLIERLNELRRVAA